MALAGAGDVFGTRGLVLSWQVFDDERALLWVMDLSLPVVRYSLVALRARRVMARWDRRKWEEIERFVADLVRARGDAPDAEWWDAAVQKLRGQAMPHT